MQMDDFLVRWLFGENIGVKNKIDISVQLH